MSKIRFKKVWCGAELEVFSLCFALYWKDMDFLIEDNYIQFGPFYFSWNN